MNLAPYRAALALPGVRSLVLVALVARIPATMTTITLTLYVVLGLDRGYGAAGLAAAVMTIGSALGAPLLGRLVDRRGLRTVLVLATVGTGLFWASAPALPYPVLLGTALLGGLVSLPVFGVVRQSLAALVPEQHRRPAYALDSMAVELSYMAGPALAVLLATSGSPRLALLAVGAGLVLSGVALFLLNPPVRAENEPTPAERPVARREWLTPHLFGLLAITAATTLVLGGTDVAVVAVLRAADQVAWTGLVVALWGAYSLLGGFAYGAVRRPPPPVLLVLLLGLCTIPVGLGGGQWWWLALALVPAGLLCAPSLTSTVDAVSRLVPSTVRGEAMGLHNSALTTGLALGSPLAGAVIDATGPGWGLAATGLAGALVALALLPALRGHQEAVGDTTTPEPVEVAPAGGVDGGRTAG
ncbi:MFS transporter [Micromonospora sp. HM5-17]|uniref:MFS transporter n=1 Tax=Micromonospora sp. HM5-17 TaxID=2487710 RepID=UPI000F492C92|nr:MFS transporter [Micromonospora sp. HM5-17]ROT31726.1 MFS transporter [Micromonospora sp. HM5-17]